jgi:N-acyl-D-aspartate/D-glutamate deacylase
VLNACRVLAHHVRELGVLRLEDVERKVTSVPAQRFGFRDRGLLQEGKAADILLFDPTKVESPATFKAPPAYAEGIEYVIINGKMVVEQAGYNGKPSVPPEY